jgi:bisanhydrobacterioruberin hydratase
MQEPNGKRLLWSTLLLVIIHLAGIIGLLSSYRNLFLMVTPLNLILSAFLLVHNHIGINKQFFLFLLISFFTGFLVELIGVNTGILFGHYTYESALGFKLLNVPVIIGINWFILTFCAGIICNKIKGSIYLRSCIGACMLVVMDYLIERIAPQYYFWTWRNGIIPFQNYVAWFIISFVILLVFYKLNFNKMNRLAPSLFVIQLVFFALLGII